MEEGTEYEYIPRVVRPLNHPQHRSNRRRTESQQQLRNQQRAGRWRNSQHQSLQVKENKRLFKWGADQLRADMNPTQLQIVGELNRGKGRSDLASGEGSNIRAEADEIHRGQTDEDNTIQELLNQWECGAHGYVPEKKGQQHHTPCM